MSLIEELANTPDVSLINTNVDDLLGRAIETYEAKYKELTGEDFTLMPADKDRVLLYTAVYLTMMSLIASDTEFKQGTLRDATGSALDAIGMTRGSVERPQSKFAFVPIKYSFDGELQQTQTIPKGNRVSVGEIYFETLEDVVVEAGTEDITLNIRCTVAGVIGNGFAPNTITTHADPLAWVKSVTNTETSQGGTSPDDDDYTRLIYNTPETYAIAGPRDAYIAQTKKFSDAVQDVCVISPDDAISFQYKFDDNQEEKTEDVDVDIKNQSIVIDDTNITDYDMNLSSAQITLQFDKPVKEMTFNFTRGGIVNVYPLLENSEIPESAFLENLKEYLSAKDKRPLTDKVETIAPTREDYAINFEYYIDNNDANKTETIIANVNKAVLEFQNWQKSKLGLDINPDELIKRVKEAGAKRLVVTSPVYTELEAFEVANCTSTTVTYKGLE